MSQEPPQGPPRGHYYPPQGPPSQGWPPQQPQYPPQGHSAPPQGPYGQPPPQQPYYPPQGQWSPPPPQGQWQQPPYPSQYGQPQPPYYPVMPPKKKGGAGKVILIVLGSIVGLFVLIGIISAASGGSKTSTAPAGNANIAAVGPTAKPNATSIPTLNQTVSVKNWDMTVTGVEKPGKTLQMSQYGMPTSAVGTWVVVQVKMKNTGNQNFGVNSFDYQLKAPNNIIYKTSDKLEAYGYSTYRGGQDVSGQVPPGTEVTFYLVFDVAPDAAGLQLQFNQDKKPVVDLGI